MGDGSYTAAASSRETKFPGTLRQKSMDRDVILASDAAGHGFRVSVPVPR